MHKLNQVPACLLQVSCSSGGLCIGSTPLPLTATTAPVISLRNNSYSSSLVEVKQGHSYVACAGSQQPTSGVLMKELAAHHLGKQRSATHV